LARLGHILGAMGNDTEAKAALTDAKRVLLQSDLPRVEREATFGVIDRDLAALARGERLDPRM
jgi:hypothetical protein